MKISRVFKATTVGLLTGVIAIGGISTATAATQSPSTTATQHQAPAPNREDVGSMVRVNAHKVWLNSQELKSQTFEMRGANQTGADLKFTVGLTKDNPIDVEADNMLIWPATLKVHNDLTTEGGELNVAGMHLRYRNEGERQIEGKVCKYWKLDIHPTTYAHEYVHNTNQDDGVKGTIKNKTKDDIDLRLGAWGGQPVRLKAGQTLLFFDSHEFNNYRGMKFEVFPAGSDRWTTSAYLGDFFDNRKPVSEVYRHGKSVDVKYYERWEKATFGDDQTGLVTAIERERGDALPTPHENGATSDWPEFKVEIIKW